jgi:hypothetical protein
MIWLSAAHLPRTEPGEDWEEEETPERCHCRSGSPDACPICTDDLGEKKPSAPSKKRLDRIQTGTNVKHTGK